MQKRVLCQMIPLLVYLHVRHHIIPLIILHSSHGGVIKMAVRSSLENARPSQAREMRHGEIRYARMILRGREAESRASEKEGGLERLSKDRDRVLCPFENTAGGRSVVDVTHLVAIWTVCMLERTNEKMKAGASWS